MYRPMRINCSVCHTFETGFRVIFCVPKLMLSVHDSILFRRYWGNC